VLHEKNVVLTVKTVDTPRVHDEDRVRIEHVGDSFWKIMMIYGYMETPNIPRGLAILRKLGFKFDIMATSFFLSRRSIRPGRPLRHAALAGQALHRARDHRDGRHRLLPDPDRPRGRGGDAGDGVAQAPLRSFARP
jgi:K+ transporter